MNHFHMFRLEIGNFSFLYLGLTLLKAFLASKGVNIGRGNRGPRGPGNDKKENVMKKRLKASALILALALLLGLPLAATAQEPGFCPEDGPAMMGPGPHHGLMGRLAEELELTDEQRSEIRAIVEEELPAARQRIEERVNVLLTPEQQEKLAELKANRPEKGDRGRRMGKRGRMGRGMGPGPGPRLEMMTEKLDLTDEQQAAIREILDEAAPPKRSEIREQIKSVLTPEQQEKMEELREERCERMAERRGF
jgi:Spy/CpxP family protein refolding chaperone